MLSDVEQSAARILEQNPGPVVRYRLLRDVLLRPPESPHLRRAKLGLDLSGCIRQLAEEQWADGGWGAFHSAKARQKQRIASTETGVERALALGLDPSHTILHRASAYIEAIMQGRILFPDYQEKNDRWPTGMRLFLASTLSLVEPTNPVLNQDRELWREIVTRAFRSGRYSEQDEIDAHAELTGATVKGSYLVLNSKYQLNLLGSLPGTLSADIEMALLDWLWERPDGIGYLHIPLDQPPPTQPGPFDRWFASLELLSSSFPAWTAFAEAHVSWLWRQADRQGLWDFGVRPRSSSVLPLSDNWRRKQDRVFDWSTRVLILLRRYCKAGNLE